MRRVLAMAAGLALARSARARQGASLEGVPIEMGALEKAFEGITVARNGAYVNFRMRARTAMTFTEWEVALVGADGATLRSLSKGTFAARAGEERYLSLLLPESDVRQAARIVLRRSGQKESPRSSVLHPAGKTPDLAGEWFLAETGGDLQDPANPHTLSVVRVVSQPTRENDGYFLFRFSGDPGYTRGFFGNGRTWFSVTRSVRGARRKVFYSGQIDPKRGKGQIAGKASLQDQAAMEAGADPGWRFTLTRTKGGH